MHGTAPWRADHERRTRLYKYCVSEMTWSRARVLPPPDVPLPPATASAPHRAGGSTSVRSVTLQRRTGRGAVGAPQDVRCSPSREGARQPGSATKDGEEQLEGSD